MAKRAGAKKGKRNYRKKSKVSRSLKLNMPERASMTEILTSGTLQTNTGYSQYNLSLASLTRAQNVAKAYQFYRIKRCVITIKPQFDTFTAGGANSVPYLYYMIDRTKQFANGFSVQQLRACGAKPRRIDDKTIEFSFAPSVLTETYDNTALATTAVQWKKHPWLPCRDIAMGVGTWNPNSTDHLGIAWVIDTQGANFGVTFERRIEVEFCKPLVPIMTGLTPPLDLDDPTYFPPPSSPEKPPVEPPVE